MSVDAILQAVEALSEAEQADLLEQLQEKYGDNDAVIPPSPELLEELERRVAEAKSGEHPGYTWDEVVAYVKRKR